MTIYRVIEHNDNTGDYHRKSFSTLYKAECYKYNCEEEEIELQEQAYKCLNCAYGGGTLESCEELKFDNGVCMNRYLNMDASTFSIEKEEVE